jgi:hypothetical protein
MLARGSGWLRAGARDVVRHRVTRRGSRWAISISVRGGFFAPSVLSGAELSCACGRCQYKAFTRLRCSKNRAFTRLRRASYFLLSGQEKCNQREGHPGQALCGLPALRVRNPPSGPLDGTSLCRRSARAHRCARPFGLFLRSIAAWQGPRLVAILATASDRALPTCAVAERGVCRTDFFRRANSRGSCRATQSDTGEGVLVGRRLPRVDCRSGRDPDGHGWPECRKCRSNFLPIWWPSWPRPQAACFE